MNTRPWTGMIAVLGVTVVGGNMIVGMALQTPGKPDFPKPPGIERLDPALDKLIAPDATIEVLAGGYTWSEGPIWVKDGGYLLFSDIPPNEIHRWKEGEGARLYLKPSGYTGSEPRGGEVGSNGLTIDREGRLVLGPARGPAHRPHGRAARQAAGEVHDDCRSLQRRAVQQPERRRSSTATATSTSPIRRTAWRSSGAIRSGKWTTPACSGGARTAP